MELFISGYGEGGATSISKLSMEQNSVKVLWSASVASCSYLSSWGDYLFGISEFDKVSRIHLFKRSINADGDCNLYQLMDTRELDGGLLCHIAFLPQNKILCGACYESGDVFTVGVKEDRFGELISFEKQGARERKLTRAHCLISDKSERMLYSANIALDRIYRYKLQDGRLIEDSVLQLSSGEGPRHLVLDEVNRLLYGITEYSNKIHIIDLQDDCMKYRQEVSILPENFSGTSYGSSLCLSRNGQFMYAANRGADTIAVFRREMDGSLIKIGDCSCYGHWPRHIELLQGDEFLGIANQESNQVVLVKLDPISGLLTGDKREISFNKPSFITECAGVK